MGAPSARRGFPRIRRCPRALSTSPAASGGDCSLPLRASSIAQGGLLPTWEEHGEVGSGSHKTRCLSQRCSGRSTRSSQAMIPDASLCPLLKLANASYPATEDLASLLRTQPTALKCQGCSLVAIGSAGQRSTGRLPIDSSLGSR